MTSSFLYSPEQARVTYHSKDGKEQKTYDALEWLAAMACHVPERRKQTIRYYGEFSNCVRGRRRKGEDVEPIPRVLGPELSGAQARKNLARLVQKVYETDPLVCSHCQGRLKLISFIEGGETIRRILEHMGLWLANARPTRRAHSPPGLRPLHENSYSQLPAAEEEDSSQLPQAQWDC